MPHLSTPCSRSSVISVRNPRYALTFGSSTRSFFPRLCKFSLPQSIADLPLRALMLRRVLRYKWRRHSPNQSR